MDLSGCIDLHVHSGPDLRPRRLDDVALARAARAAGYRAILLKSHHTLTADRAAIAEQVVGGVRVFGGLALNHAVGGMNPAAVETALRMGAKEIWMPTVSAVVEHARVNKPDPVRVDDGHGRLLPAAREVLALIRDRGAILGTGHLTIDEVRLVVAEARDLGLRRILLTHPEHPLLAFSLDAQRALAAQGVLFERCFCFSLGAIPGHPVPLSQIAAAIREVGADSTVLATDLGRADLPDPVEGLGVYLAELAREGLPEADLAVMARENPTWLLDL